MRCAARIDRNQPKLVSFLRQLGAKILHLHTLGKGCPDVLIAYRGKMFLVEIKDPAKPPSKRKLTDKEALFFNEWNGYVSVIETETDCLKLLGIQSEGI